MPAYPESVSTDPAASQAEDAVLIAGVNWLGDSIMSMPAIQSFRQAHPQTRLVMLVKPQFADLWALQGAIDETWTLPGSLNGMIRLARQAAARRFRAAYILPHSFRSALVPFLAHIPERVGLTGHTRDWMLTRVVRPPAIPGREHQCHEYMALLGMSEQPAPASRLILAKALLDQAQSRLGTANASWAALMPGAAYGPAKCWPAEHYIALGGMLKLARNCGIVLLGSACERDLCTRVAQEIGPGTVNFAGQTSLPELAAILSRCAVVVTNDSGGMHLAAAVGTPVVAIFGITDPQKTGPLGTRARVLQDSARRSRDIERTSEEAILSLRRIRPEQALEAVRALLGPFALGEDHAR